MDNRKTIWKELIKETKVKLQQYPITLGPIYDKYSSLRIDYYWTDRENFTQELDSEIEQIILEAEKQSEDLLLSEKNKNTEPQRETFVFEKGKTFFGLTIHAYGIKESDIKELPFYNFWEEAARGRTCAVFNEETYVYLHDWERFCYSFILHGTHHHIKTWTE